MNHGADGFAHGYSHYIAGGVQIENDNRQLVVPAHGDGGRVHHAQALGEHLEVGDLGVPDGLVGELQRIAIVDAIDARSLDDHVGLDLERAQGGGGVGGKVRVGGASGENGDAALFQVADGAAADVRFGPRPHLDGSHHASRDADLLESVGERQRVDDGGEHAHVVGRNAIHLAARAGDAAEDIAAAHHHAHLDAGRGHAGNLLRQAVDAIGIDAELRAARQHLAAQLQQDALVSGHLLDDRFGHGAIARGFGRCHVAHLVADEAADADVLAQLGNPGFDELVDGEGGLFDEGLVEQAHLFVELAETAFHNAVEDLLRLALQKGAGAGDLFFLFEHLRGHVLTAQVAGIGGGDRSEEEHTSVLLSPMYL